MMALNDPKARLHPETKTDTPASVRADLFEWSKGKPLAVREHAMIVAANLKKIEREGMPTHPAIVATFMDNVKRLARVAGR